MFQGKVQVLGDASCDWVHDRVADFYLGPTLTARLAPPACPRPFMKGGSAAPVDVARSC